MVTMFVLLGVTMQTIVSRGSPLLTMCKPTIKKDYMYNKEKLDDIFNTWFYADTIVFIADPPFLENQSTL